ncbi:MAG: hypothetical protein DRJ13_15475, partial [Bacteroidetes bacterium]
MQFEHFGDIFPGNTLIVSCSFKAVFDHLSGDLSGNTLLKDFLQISVQSYHFPFYPGMFGWDLTNVAESFNEFCRGAGRRLSGV